MHHHRRSCQPGGWNKYRTKAGGETPGDGTFRRRRMHLLRALSQKGKEEANVEASFNISCAPRFISYIFISSLSLHPSFFHTLVFHPFNAYTLLIIHHGLLQSFSKALQEPLAQRRQMLRQPPHQRQHLPGGCSSRPSPWSRFHQRPPSTGTGADSVRGLSTHSG